MKKPEPVPSSLLCSLCGQDWEKHPKRKTGVVAEDCVKLLKAELARRPLQFSQLGQGGGFYPYQRTFASNS